MEILQGLASLPDRRLAGSCVTWGVFDGVHRGHRKVLRRLLELAGEGPAAVVTFDRHPVEVLRDTPVPLIVPLDERLRLIGEQGVAFVLVLPFTREFSKTTAEEFVRDIVASRMGARRILLGHDSHFGRDRQGDVELLATLGRSLGIDVETCAPEVHEGTPISSSLIRRAIAEGRTEAAADLLGRPWSLRGIVTQGDRRGALLGFPTANVELREELHPLRGVYAVEADLDGKTYRGVANLGRRPTFHGEGAPEILEVHLLDFFGGDLYDRALIVRFLARLRDEKKFSGVDELRAQIRADIAAVRKRT